MPPKRFNPTFAQRLTALDSANREGDAYVDADQILRRGSQRQPQPQPAPPAARPNQQVVAAPPRYVSFEKNHLSRGEWLKHDRFRAMVSEKLGFELHEWQSVSSFLVSRGKDVVVVAPTGGGKSIAFQSLIVNQPTKMILVIVPITSLMKDQVRALGERRIKACFLSREAINAEPNLIKKIRDGHYSIVYAFPEMTRPDNGEFWKIINTQNSRFRTRLIALVIDEAHCVYKWGASGTSGPAFRPEYANIGALRSFFPDVPFMSLSATLTKSALNWIHDSLKLTRGTILVKESIDRPNIFLCGAPIRSPVDSYADLDILMPKYTQADVHDWWWEDIPKTMIFIDSRPGAQAVVRRLMNRVPRMWQYLPIVRAYSSIISEAGNEKNMALFVEGKIRILVCTDAAGMGVNIGDVERVIQYKIPVGNSFDTLWQRFGRCARDPKLRGLAILFHEKEKAVGDPKPGPRRAGGAVQNHPFSEWRKPAAVGSEAFIKKIYKAGSEASDSTRGIIPMAEHRTLKSVDPGLLWFTSTTGCRRQVLLYLFDDKGAGKPLDRAEVKGEQRDFPVAGLGCQNCDRCLLDIPDVGLTRSGIDLRICLPFKPPNIPTKRATHGLVASASVNQITHLCSELRRWNLRRYTDELSRNDEKDFYPVLATNWLMGPKEVQLIAEYANEIKTVDNLRDVLSPGYNLDLSPLEPFAEKLVQSLQRFVQKRPPSPLPLLPDTPSQRYILEAAEYLKTPPIRTPVSRGPNDSAYLETIAAMATIPAMAEEILETRRESIKQSRRLTRSQSSLNINETGIDGSQPEKDASQASQSENSQHSRKRRKPPGQPKYAKKA